MVRVSPTHWQHCETEFYKAMVADQTRWSRPHLCEESSISWMGFDKLDFLISGLVPERPPCSPIYPGSAIVDRGKRTLTFVDDLQNMMTVRTRNQDHHGAFSVCLKPTSEEIELAPLTKFIISCKFDVGVHTTGTCHFLVCLTSTPRTNYTYFFFVTAPVSEYI